jgi:uncharacterized protein (DUF433 family)
LDFSISSKFALSMRSLALVLAGKTCDKFINGRVDGSRAQIRSAQIALPQTGHTIFMELREKNHHVTLWDMRDVQRVFDKIIRPFLRNVDFDSARVPRRWWPRGKHRQVASDPRRSFGHPIIFREGIPTRVLARSVRANDSIEEVARWFQINPISVHEAVDYEQALAA